ncbi:MAG: hypothetical protein JO354_10645 [Verrucomicrobia bacterium]|nr:hypothetical protein [Verrucomicrobiota bacterium]
MPQNTLPSGIYDLMHLAESIALGLDNYGQWIKLGGEVPEFRAALKTLREAESAFASQRSEKAAAATWMNAADAALTEWLAKARLAVMLARGMRWSHTWIEAGFTHRRTNVPKAIAPRIELARRLVDFLSSHPQFGVAHAEVTATHGRKLYDDIVAARQVHRRLTGACNDAKRARDAAERHMRCQMRSIIVLLSAAMRSNDSRWLEFGLNKPRARRCETWVERAAPKSAITALIPPSTSEVAASHAAA